MAWSMSVPTRHVDPDGTAIVVTELTDDTTGAQFTVTVTMTATAALKVLCERADGTPPLSGFEAWSA